MRRTTGHIGGAGRLELALLWAGSRRAAGRLRRDEGGQAVVESAIVIPLMTFVILGVIQLVMIQHARIMNEYAAFNAARAGIVWNADRWIMENAALISLLPTNEALAKGVDIRNPVQMLRRILQRALLYQVNRRLPQAVNLMRKGATGLIGKIPGGTVGNAAKGALTKGVDQLLNLAQSAAEGAAVKAIGNALGSSEDRLVRVDIITPRLSFNVPGMGPLPGYLGGSFGRTNREVDFDDFKKRGATRLTIRVRYMYMLRVPFANWVIHSAWLAGQAGKRLYGAVWNPQQNAPGETGFRDKSPLTPTNAGAKGFLASWWSRLEERDLTVASKLAAKGVYMVPLNSSYSMRMQSNPYRKSVQLR